MAVGQAGYGCAFPDDAPTTISLLEVGERRRGLRLRAARYGVVLWYQ